MLLCRQNVGYIDRIKEWCAEYNSETEVRVDTENFPIEIVTPKKKLQAHLYVPTKSDGASISQSGWKLGDGTLSRTTSSGTVEEDVYQDNVVLLRVNRDEIELGVLLSNKLSPGSDRKVSVNETEPERNMRIPMGEITDVRSEDIDSSYARTFPGFIFETADDVYKLGFHVPEQLISPTNIEKEWIPEVVKKIRSQSDRQTSDDGSIEKLEQLKELHEEGVLTDSEFDQKKKEILDNI
jgi:hypothetical protein